MRILVIGANPGPDTMEKHVIETLAHMGHEVSAFNDKDIININPAANRVVRAVLSRMLREPERLIEKRLLDRVAAFQPDLIIVLLGSGLSPRTIPKLRRLTSARIVCWCQDQMTTMGRQYLIGAGYDRVYVKDHYLVHVLRDFAGLDVEYLPEACNPRYHRIVELAPDERERFRSDICTFGNVYYYRQALLQPLLCYDLQVWGFRPDWLVDQLGASFKGRPVFEEEKCKVISGARIVLNTLHFGEVAGLNCRAFEVAGCGGFQLMTHTEAIAEHFRPGEEVESFRDRAELLDKVEHYLANPEAARAIALAGHRRAMAEHTYRHRLARLVAGAAA